MRDSTKRTSAAIRDERARTREHSPLEPAPGAVILDTTELSLGANKLLVSDGRELDDMAPSVGGIAAARDQPAFLEFVKQSDDIAGIQAEQVTARADGSIWQRGIRCPDVRGKSPPMR